MAFEESNWSVKLTGNEKYCIFVESPSEAKNIGSFINKYYKGTVCLSTNGHFCELKEGEDYGIKGFDDFLNKKVKKISSLEPKLVVEKGHYNVEKNLRKVIETIRKNKGTIFLSTDPDREGEFISYEVMKFYDLKESEYIRVRSTSIEEHDYIESLEKAIKNNQKLDKNLYNAAIVRTLLDKLYGYIQTKKLWSITSNNQSHYNLLIGFLNKKIEEFKDNNKGLENNEQFNNVINKYEKMLDNLRNLNNTTV